MAAFVRGRARVRTRFSIITPTDVRDDDDDDDVHFGRFEKKRARARREAGKVASVLIGICPSGASG